MHAIQCEKLCKDYRTGFWRRRSRVLHDLDLTVEAGETFGYLGPNGAGKTTTLKILLGLVRPTAGRALILGGDVTQAQARTRVGFLPETPSYYEYLTAEEFLLHIARLTGLPDRGAREQVPALLDQAGLTRARATQLRKFSKGMLQRLGLAQALLGDPHLVILDEPMSGLDPIGRKEVRDTILRLRAEGRTVFFSTHIIPDVEMICDRVGILMGGRLVRVGRLSELLSTEVESIDVTVADCSPDLVAALTHEAAQPPLVEGSCLLFRLVREDAVTPFLRRVAEAGGRVLAVTPQKRSLEEIFLAEVQTRGRT
jgi:ABC-2 type transport system ATP-binding protein